MNADLSFRPTGFGDVVLVDLDSTLSDTRPRRHLAPTVDPTKTWTDFSLGAGDDRPIPGPIRLVQMLDHAGYDIHIVTGRHTTARTLTEDWLTNHYVPYHRLRMRTDADPTDSGHIKLAYVSELRARQYRIVLALEDNVDIANALEDRGVPVLCCNPRYGSRP